MDIRVLLIFGLITIFSLFLLWKENLLEKNKYIFFAVLLLGIAFAVRATLLEYRSGDYNSFLIKWVDYYRQNGGFKALSTSLGNYNLPYLYFLALFSYSSINDLYLIKLLSIFFDVILAFGMLKLSSVFTESKAKRLAVFLIIMLLPTVVLNGAMWGQCDSIYVAFAVLSLWAVLSGKGKLSMVFLALSFGFKLQAVFIIPVFLVMLFAKRIKFRDYFIFPLSYLLLISPAVIAGRPFKEAFLLYFDQATTVGSGLNYNSPSLFSLVSGNVNNSAASAVGVAATFICVFLVFYLTWKQRKNLSDKALLFVTLLFVVGIPFLLPHMHDRYFFMADVLTLLPAIIAPAFAPIAIMTSLASLICYFAYFNQAYFLPLQYGTILLIGVLVILLINTLYLINSNRGPKPFLQT